MLNKKVSWQLHTAGDGHWSDQARMVHIIRVWVNYVNEEEDFGELCAEFDTASWCTEFDGLIYTDSQWIAEFRALMKSLGFSPCAVDAIDYSEQGMQGEDYVSMDVGEAFVRELEPMYRWTINKEAINA